MYESSEVLWWANLMPWVWLGIYVYFCGCQFAVAKKLGHKYPWWSFIPILNLFQIVQLAERPLWWFVLYLIPVVNVIIYAWLWVEIAQKRQKPAFWGVFMIIPFLNLIAPVVLATGEQQRVGPKDYTKAEEREYAPTDSH